jgi:hypothetical protein
MANDIQIATSLGQIPLIYKDNAMVIRVLTGTTAKLLPILALLQHTCLF